MSDLTYAIDDIKARLTCHDVAARLNIQMPRRGDATCPKHAGQSLRIKDDWWRCFGGCDAGGDVISLYMWHEGVDFMTALKQLADWAGVTLKLDPAAVRAAEQRRRVEDILAIAADFYASRYAGSPAEAYAKQRGLDVAEARLGYAPDAWRDLCDHLTAQGIDLAQAEEAGLVKRNSRGHYDHLRHRLVVPAYDRGRCVFLTGRALSGGTTGEKPSKYLHVALGDPPLYHLNGALRMNSKPILTESVTDVLRFESSHLPGVGTYGTAIRDAHARLLRNFDTIYVAAHNDAAGAEYVNRCAEALGERIRVAPSPDGFKDWDEALKAGTAWAPDDALTWFRWRLRQMPADLDPVTGKKALAPLIEYLATLDDAALSTHYLDEMRRHFSWTRDIHRAYDRDLKTARAARAKQTVDRQRVKSDDSGATVNVKPDPTFINPAQAYHSGIVYVARNITRTVTVPTRRGDDEQEVDIYRPVIITSDRRLIDPPAPPKNAPPGAVIYINDLRTLALTKPMEQASNQWSYNSVSAHLRGDAPEVQPHIIYDQLLADIKQYVYHDDPGDYVINVLWAMGTFFHQQFDAFPYLIINGHKGAGKTTLLHWLHHVAFNSTHVVNTSEASLFRWIEAAAPTMLIDEQEGLNSRKAAKEDQAALMGILKSGYQRGTTVTRQDPNNPSIRQTFEVYCPKALAAVEQFEDILSDRGILVYMPKVGEAELKRHGIKPRNQMDGAMFQTIRDNLYLLLMQWSDELQTIRQKIQNTHGARFGELIFPLLCMAALVDAARGQGRHVLAELEAAIARQSTKRDQRNAFTPEELLAEAVRTLCGEAEIAIKDRPQSSTLPQRLSNGHVVMDARHISDAFRSLFPNANESYFRAEWLGRQVNKTSYIDPWQPEGFAGKHGYRWRREVKERDPNTGDVETVIKQFSTYIVYPDKL